MSLAGNLVAKVQLFYVRSFVQFVKRGEKRIGRLANEPLRWICENSVHRLAFRIVTVILHATRICILRNAIPLASGSSDDVPFTDQPFDRSTVRPFCRFQRTIGITRIRALPLSFFWASCNASWSLLT